MQVKEIDQKLTVEQIFDLLHIKLEGRERADQFCRQNAPSERWRSPTRDGRYVRVTDAKENEMHDGEDKQGRGSKKKKDGRNRSSSPMNSGKPVHDEVQGTG